MHTISTSKIDLNTIKDILLNNKKIELSEEAKQNIVRCRDY